MDWIRKYQEFNQNLDRMCDSIDDCNYCPVNDIACCLSTCSTSEQAEQLVAVVKEWASANPDESNGS